MRLRGIALAVTALGALLGCGEPSVDRVAVDVSPTPRRVAVWLDETGVDAETARRLHEVGVDQLVVRRGTIDLGGAAPVVRLLPPPPVAGPVPAAAAFVVRGLSSKVGTKAADALWAVLETDFGDSTPTELLLDLPEVGPDTAEFLTALARRSGLAVIPMLTVSQLSTASGQAAARATHRCVVPVFGPQHEDLRGLDDMDAYPLSERLAAVRDLDVRLRLAVSLRPETVPQVSPWAEDIDPLTDGNVAEMRRTSPLDRSFTTLRRMTWGGVELPASSSIDVAWIDTARLGIRLLEGHRMVLPELDGWDLVSLPPGDGNLGLDREELIRYLGGEGPAPTINVRLERSGRRLLVRMANQSVFRSAVAGFANWVQVELSSGALVASSRGDFDRVVLGSTARGEWQPNPSGAPDAVRFFETYIAPGEELATGAIRLPSSRSRVVVRWQVQLSDGSTVGGVVD